MDAYIHSIFDTGRGVNTLGVRQAWVQILDRSFLWTICSICLFPHRSRIKSFHMFVFLSMQESCAYLFLKIIFYLSTATLIHLCTVHGRFCATTTGMSSCKRDRMAWKAENIYYLALFCWKSYQLLACIIPTTAELPRLQRGARFSTAVWCFTSHLFSSSVTAKKTIGC